MDIKAWLEGAGFRGRVAENAFQKPPPLPYINYLDGQSRHGGDYEGGICTHSLTVELYSARIDERAEKRLEQLFVGMDYRKNRVYLSSERFFMTVYELELTEKE